MGPSFDLHLLKKPERLCCSLKTLWLIATCFVTSLFVLNFGCLYTAIPLLIIAIPLLIIAIPLRHTQKNLLTIGQLDHKSNTVTAQDMLGIQIMGTLFNRDLATIQMNTMNDLTINTAIMLVA